MNICLLWSKMIFLANPQVWHLPGTWSDQPIDGPYLGLTSSQLTLLASSILITLFVTCGIYIIQISKSKRQKSC